MPTGPIYETNQVAKRDAIPDEIFMVEKDKTPVFSWLTKTTVEANMLGQVVLEKYPACPSTGVIDGTAVTTVEYVERETADVCAQWFREPWGVTRLAGATNTYGVKDEKGHQRAWAMKKLRRQLEIQICSADDCASESGATPWTTRGIFSWLSTTAQTTRPVPTNFLPGSSTQYTSAMNTSTLTDTALLALMQAAFDETHAPLDLDLFVGGTAKRVIGELTQADPYRMDGLDTVHNKVMLIDVDYGVARVHLAPFLYYTTSTGAASAYTPLSGFGLNKGQWAWEWIKGNAPANTDLAPDGSGDRGYIDCIGRLWSRNPQGQISIVSSSTT
jgi:hypothetical protein